MATEGFDLLHYNAPQVAVRRWELRNIFRVPAIVSFRGQDFSFHPERYDRLLTEADHLHFISSHLINEARKRGFRGSNYSLIPPIVDMIFYSPDHQNHKHDIRRVPTLFSAARLNWVKRLGVYL